MLYDAAMDIEKLSKSQIVLLTLLVSFVTSIATGIVTVSLMDQAPPVVAQTVNRVIEHTVEKIVPTNQSAAAGTVQTKTIVVNDSSLIAQAIAGAQPSVVRLYESSGTQPAFLGLGVVLNANGTIVADASGLGDRADAEAVRSDGGKARMFVTSRDNAAGLAFLSPATSSATTSLAWTPLPVSSNAPSLGQSVVSISGKTADTVGQGIVTSLMSANSATSTRVIDTNIPVSSLESGSPLITTDGTLLGISTGVSRSAAGSGFTPAAVLESAPAPQ